MTNNNAINLNYPEKYVKYKNIQWARRNTHLVYIEKLCTYEEKTAAKWQWITEIFKTRRRKNVPYIFQSAIQ